MFRSDMASVLRLFAILAAAVLLTAAPAGTAVRIRIDLAAQRLEAVTPQGETVTWKISSGRRGYETPTGHYGVMRMEADHHSDEYEQAPMPYAIFFSPRGLAIHGSYEHGLGRPLSHGCVRLAVPNARQLFQWVEKDGATIEITGGGGAIARDEPERPRLARQPRSQPRPMYRPDYQEPAFPSNMGDFPF
ncbi:L,D-transpeptidase [Methylocystis sp.]|uniref:L,D-transpeptidase n=1 Tax=Methylocystis sp. TaxID=1911079 RepID=UPI0025D8248E|nr:L,D-transpeptidase [Methylocystis sp.]